MKRIKNYIVMGLLGIVLASCGTDLEPEVFPVRTIENVQKIAFPDGYLGCQTVFVSDKELYIANGASKPIIYAYNLQNGEWRDVSLVVEDDNVDGYFSQTLSDLLYSLLESGSRRPGGLCWASGKGYVIGEDMTFIYSPEGDTWTYVTNTGFSSYNSGSNMVLLGDNCVQISPTRIYTYSLSSHKWSSIPITHDFTYNYSSSAGLFSVNNKLYACAYDPYDGLYVYDAETHLWNEVEMKLDRRLSKFSIYKVLMTDDTVYYFTDNMDFMLMECNLKDGNLSSIISGSVLNAGLDFYRTFNVGSTCFSYIYSGETYELIKFNLK